MKIMKASLWDVKSVVGLFKETVSIVNAKDYNPAQIEQWLLAGHNIDKWLYKIQNQFFMLAKENDTLLGFCSLTKTGHLDMLFVHKDFQGRGIARSLLAEIERIACDSGMKMISADVSITAKPFFLKSGFCVLNEQIVVLNEVELINFKVKKTIDCNVV